MAKRIFKFYMSEPDSGNEYTFKESIDDYDYDDPTFAGELSYMLDEFKRFCSAIGWKESTLKHLQFLEDDEMRYVCKKYCDWTKEDEKCYAARKKINREVQGLHSSSSEL